VTHDSTRERILAMIVAAGPISASTVARQLGVTPAGIRRHLGALTDDNLIIEHDAPGGLLRGRGRPARTFVATAEGQRALGNAYSAVANDALAFLRRRGELDEFVEGRVQELEAVLASSVPHDAPIEERVAALSAALAVEGYATSVRPGPRGLTVQLCQGHCPVQAIAAFAPEWCEAETKAFSRILDVHVQRLSTLAGGAHVCTTTIPLVAASVKEGSA